MIKKVRGCGEKPILTENPAYDPEGDTVQKGRIYEEAYTGGSYPEMHRRLHKVIIQAAKKNNTRLAYVGTAWNTVFSGTSVICIVESNGVHPTIAGSYLIACCYAQSITGIDSIDFNWRPAELTLNEAVTIREAVKKTLILPQFDNKD